MDAYHKGLDIMVQAVRKQQNLLRDNKCTFEIYGPNILGRAEQLQEMIDTAGVADIIKQYGPISGEDKKNLILESDIFIQTSRFEGMPLGILEAMSYGIPCLVTQGTTLGEEIEKVRAGWMADTTADSVANVFKRCIADKSLLSKYGNNARCYVKDNFAWSKIAKKTIALYEKLVRQ